jgi:hypothetical protein
LRAVIRTKLQKADKPVKATDALTGEAVMLDVTAGNVLTFDEIKDR